MAQHRVSYVRFNQDMSCFVCIAGGDLRVFNVEPLIQMLHVPTELIGRVRIAEMLDRSNFIALVSADLDHPCPENVLRLLDVHGRAFRASVTFGSAILDVRMRKDRLIVILLTQIHVFTFPGLQKLTTFDTRDNPSGLCQVSRSSVRATMVFPSQGCAGFVRIVDVGSQLEEYALQRRHRDRSATAAVTSDAATTSSAPTCVQAHDSELACLAVSGDGTRFATASIRGTLIRVFDCTTRARVAELRRGSDAAIMHCIAFSADGRYLCATSDKGSVHVFAVGDDNAHMNPRSALADGAAAIAGVTFGDYCLSVAQFSVPDRCACAFDWEGGSSIVAVCFDGTFYKYAFVTATRGCSREVFDKFLELGDNCEM